MDRLEECDLWGAPIAAPSRGPLADRFDYPPFSVLNARDGWWQERKRVWIAQGIQGELGRGGEDTARCFGQDLMRGEHVVGKVGHQDENQTGTSIFDPVLCELSYRWFCPPAGQILDPFAGGSVRGIVAGIMGHRYHGIDLRPEQVEANERQADEIRPDVRPVWVCGDSIDEIEKAPPADFVFSCPPYGDLERYSDDPRDLSTMEYHTFKASMGRIVLRCAAQLKPNRFAAFVVGEFRCRRGFYRNFIGDTVQAFEAAGMSYYNEAVLVTAVGSLPIRVGKQFTTSRKLGKTHQNLLVFVKGDPRIAARACGATAGEDGLCVNDVP